MTTSMISLDDNTFPSFAAQATLPILIDFWAPWCAPCHGISRYLEQRAGDFADKLIIIKVNADEAVETAALYGVRGLPTLVLIKSHKLVETRIGVLSSSKLEALLVEWSQI